MPTSPFTAHFFKSTVIATTCFLAACSDAPTEQKEAPKRGLRTIIVEATDPITFREYPSVLEPADTTELSFETNGQLARVDLEVGQRVKRGDTLMSLDPTSLDLQVQSSKSALDQALSQAENARKDYERKQELFKGGNTSASALDQSRTDMESGTAQAQQARKQYELALENRTKAELKAPFDGVISDVNANSFQTLNAGQRVANIYQESGFEISFTVAYEVVNRMETGQEVEVRLADKPGQVYSGFVKELGSRAEQVSAFPVVIAFNTEDNSLKAGLAAEVKVNLPIEGATTGVLIPISAMGGEILEHSATVRGGHVFVYDENTSTVTRRQVMVSGIRNNNLYVSQGLQPGERVATAGVPFLREGQTVQLLPDTQ